LLDRQAIAQRCREKSLVAVFTAVYDTMAENSGKRDWCCKSLANVNYLPEINDYLDTAKYIYLYRDGRDVALSFRKAIIGEKHFYHIAKEWATAQRLAMQMRDRLPSDRFFSISYEYLTSQPEEILKQLCGFLNVQYSPTMLDFHQSQEAVNTASSCSLWMNLTKPLISNNTQKFLQYATDEEIRIFELVAGDVLDALGYERTQILSGKGIEFSHTAIATFDLINQQMKEEILQQRDVEDLSVRDHQTNLLQEIQSRQYHKPYHELAVSEMWYI
jgi:hypothetical protein